ncbi:MAG: hypothetical protein D6677_08165 [Calditrichaeota bacterium]|nr:MAG: hypothetical protein D6677_08165 [Calditrichota bacterium]
MRIAIGLTADHALNTAHFGESRYFRIYDISDGLLKQVDERENPVPGHHIPGKGQTIIQTIKDCQAIVVRSIGRGALTRMPRQGIDIFLTCARSLEEVENTLGASGLDAFKKLNPATGKFEDMANV